MTLSTTSPDAPRPVAAAKVRILETATDLFYRVGIHGVGVDRLISESSVTKATFYKHYGSKDRLILDYLNAAHEREREFVEGLVRSSDGAEETLRQLVASIVADIASPGFRGCAFLNAAVEFPKPLDPVRAVISKHRDWYTGVLAGLLQNIGHPMPGDAADEFMLARDGAMAGGYAGDPIAASAAFTRVAGRVILASGTDLVDDSADESFEQSA